MHLDPRLVGIGMIAGLQEIPNCKSEEQAPGTAVHQASADLDVKSGTDGTSNTDELDVTRLELAMGRIMDGPHGLGNRVTTILVRHVVLLRIKPHGFFIVVVRAAMVDSGRSHGEWVRMFQAVVGEPCRVFAKAARDKRESWRYRTKGVWTVVDKECWGVGARPYIGPVFLPSHQSARWLPCLRPDAWPAPTAKTGTFPYSPCSCLVGCEHQVGVSSPRAWCISNRRALNCIMCVACCPGVTIIPTAVCIQEVFFSSMYP